MADKLLYDQLNEELGRIYADIRGLKVNQHIFLEVQDIVGKNPNPATFFRCWGVARPESEMVFPISTTEALHGSFQKPTLEVLRVEVPQSFVRVVNGRIAHEATRFCFYHEEVDWIQKMWRKSDPYLSRIQW